MLPIDAQNNQQTFGMEVVEFSGVTAVGPTQSTTNMHSKTVFVSDSVLANNGVTK